MCVDGPLFSGVLREAQIPGRGRGRRPLLTYLQSLIDNKLAPSMIKAYAAAISSCHEGCGEGSVYVHPLVKSNLEGVRRQRPVVLFPVPQMDLLLVLSTPPANSPNLSQDAIL